MTRWAVATRLPAIQLRYKGDDDAHLLHLAKTMRRLTAGSSTRFIVNDRPDIALAVTADGVHVGQNDLPPAEVRKMVGDHMIVGLSTHNLEQVAKANSEPVDYIGFGPLYVTTSKAVPDPVVGPETLASAARISKKPVVAIGGLTLERIRRLDLGAVNLVAVISAVSQAKEPLAVMQTINQYVRDVRER